MPAIPKKSKRASGKESRNVPGRLPEEVDPLDPLDGWSVAEAVKEMQAALMDGAWFCRVVDEAERTRLCWWNGKHSSGRKVSNGTYRAQPFENAADHEVALAQEIIDERNAMRLAAITRGALNVIPTNGTDARAAANMKLVLSYYLQNAMKNIVPLMAMRAGSWADRHGSSGIDVHWHEERAVERKFTSARALVKLAAEAQAEQPVQAPNPATLSTPSLSSQNSQPSQGQPANPDNSSDISQANPTPPAPAPISIVNEEQLLNSLLNPIAEDTFASLLLDSDPGLKARGPAGQKEAKRVVHAIATALAKQSDPDQPFPYFTSYVKASHPMWETVAWFVDAFMPAETEFEPSLRKSRWYARVKWVTAQTLRQMAALLDEEGQPMWDPDWVEEVIKNCRGKSVAFETYMQQVPWVLSGVGVRWVTNTATGAGTTQSTSEARRNLFQIIFMKDISTTPDGLIGTYETVLHADIKDKVARRALVTHWDGEYPVVPFTSEKDEKLMLASRGIPERTRSSQSAITAQMNSRTDMASMTTFPPWTGPPELRGTKLYPGMFVEVSRYAGQVGPMSFPPPDGRSIEIEKSVRAMVDRQFGRMSETVPDAVSMLFGQADMDWFLYSYSEVIRKTARLVQQFMPAEIYFRLTGSEQEYHFTPEDVRGSFDFNVKFDVRSLDIEWAKELLTFVKDLILPLDRHAQVDTTPAIEFGMTMLSPDIAMRSIKPAAQASSDEQSAELADLSQIFSGGEPKLNLGMDYAARAQTMVDEYQKSPLRQQAVAQNPQIHAVFTARLKQLIDLDHQFNENPTKGRLQGDGELRVLTPAEQLLQQLQQPANVTPIAGAA